MHGITIEPRGARFRVLRTYAAGNFVTLGTFPNAGEAIEYATKIVLEIDEENP